MPFNISLKKIILCRYSKLANYALFIPLLISSTVIYASTSCANLYEKEEFKSAFDQCSIEAQQNNLNAHYILGQLYTHGFGTSKNINKGISHYRKAVLGNDVDAQIALGQFHADNKNFLQSHMFFTLAIDNGSLNALNFKDSAAKNLTSEDLELSKEFLSLVKNAIALEKKAQLRKQLASH